MVQKVVVQKPKRNQTKTKPKPNRNQTETKTKPNGNQIKPNPNLMIM